MYVCVYIYVYVSLYMQPNCMFFKKYFKSNFLNLMNQFL